MLQNKKTRSSDLAAAQRSFGITEAYKTIRANLQFAIPKVGTKRIMITSGEMSEGKTTTAFNIANSLAEANFRVLYLDCDLRRPAFHRHMHVRNELGMSNYLSNMCEIGDIVHGTDGGNLFYITAGTIPPNPAELLGTQRMQDLLNMADGQFDYVILDTPPVNVVSDALLLTKMVDGVLAVTRYMKSTHPEIREMLDRLKYAEANVLGFVLNDYDRSTGGKTYYKKYYKDGYYTYEADPDESAGN